MTRWWCLLAGVALMSACSPTGAGGTVPSSSDHRGGTLRVAVSLDNWINNQTLLDPELDNGAPQLEVYRCCLLRTLLSFEGKSTNQGGAVLRPDLAERLPDVSADGLTWTFHLRSGVHYAPPFQGQTVTAADVRRGFLRHARVGTQQGNPGASYLSVLIGFDDYVNGRASSISGLEIPDERTLVFHLVTSTWDFGYRLASPDLAPIPPSPRDPAAELGVAGGHDDGYGRFLVSTGPYMIEGADRIDYRQPVKDQKPASGSQIGKTVVLVRNPSWSSAGDALRPAYVDRIELTPTGANLSDAVRAVDEGRADVAPVWGPAPEVNPAIVDKHQRDPSLGQVHIEEKMANRFVAINLAVPPFDDVHVRKALNLVIDKAAVRDATGGQFVGRLAGHMSPDTLEEDALVNYDPYGTPGGHGDPAAARREMALSAYDPRHIGLCSAAVCKRIVVVTFSDGLEQSRIVQQGLAKIGIEVQLKPLQRVDVFRAATNPRLHTPLVLMVGWGADYPNGSNFFVPLLQGDSIPTSLNQLIGPPTFNVSLVGARPEDLRRWGYSVTAVPSVDDRISHCLSVFGSRQPACWSQLDEYMMEKVVPWVPMFYEYQIILTSPSIVRYSYDTSTTEPALDQLAVSTR